MDQCFDYLHSAWSRRDRDALVEPAFALVSDMNEFRLYIRRLGRTQCQRFVIGGPTADLDLLSNHPAAAFRRFVFWRLFQPDLMLAERGPAPLNPAPGPDWLWSEVGTPAAWKQSPEAPVGLSARDLTAWAKARHAEALQARHDELDALLQPGVALSVENTADELNLIIGGREALRLYDRPDTPFLAAQWRHTLRDLNVTEAFNAKKLQKRLLDLRATGDAPLHDRILALDAEITELDKTIATREREMNALVYRLYNLTPEEIATVEAG